MNTPSSLRALGLGPDHAARVAALSALRVVREVTEDACRDLPEVSEGGRKKEGEEPRGPRRGAAR